MRRSLLQRLPLNGIPRRILKDEIPRHAPFRTIEKIVIIATNARAALKPAAVASRHQAEAKRGASGRTEEAGEA
ncbi:MAG: hypothetical protein ABIY47_02380, partial [Opitutaceae bacterium]